MILIITLVIGAAIGGICGFNTGGIEACLNNGAVTLESVGRNPMVGGICGSVERAKACFNSGTISFKSTGDEDNPNGACGGVFGQVYGRIECCFSSGSEICEKIGGLRTGNICGFTTNSAYVVDCYCVNNNDGVRLCGAMLNSTNTGDELCDEFDTECLSSKQLLFDKILSKCNNEFIVDGDNIKLKVN